MKFKTFGCGAAVATSSMATELVKGKSIEEAIHAALWDYATKNNIVLEGLSEPKSDIHDV